MSAVLLAAPVREALAAGRGVVALETTLLSHGMPPDRRRAVAARLSGEVCAGDAVPAFVAVIDGRIRVGLSDARLDALCEASSVGKCGERDLAWALHRGGVHATTVSATLWAAAQAGIRVFATGGIGGVHRGAPATADESQDLHALARWPVAVISAGAKAVLDLPRTVERLETLGVPVVGYQCREFPAFYAAESGIALEAVVEHVEELAALLTLHFDMRQSGVLVCNAVDRRHALDRATMEAAIAAALEAARAEGIVGAALTPFLLGVMDRLTGGRSVDANVALAAANARLGGLLATALADRAFRVHEA